VSDPGSVVETALRPPVDDLAAVQLYVSSMLTALAWLGHFGLAFALIPAAGMPDKAFASGISLLFLALIPITTGLTAFTGYQWWRLRQSPWGLILCGIAVLLAIGICTMAGLMLR
jgi:hypothetical protein